MVHSKLTIHLKRHTKQYFNVNFFQERNPFSKDVDKTKDMVTKWSRAVNYALPCSEQEMWKPSPLLLTLLPSQVPIHLGG